MILPLPAVKGTRSMAAQFGPEPDGPCATAPKLVASGFAETAVKPPLT
ncbi:hypothetical protein LNV09_20495 [Paucibacter sp. B2R-40]|nr:hypothetical protein [Paucibacter sp. B2R-40]MCV2356528.1 hypothetical protein [Paucibacter sp. B2R-40]